VQTRDDHDAARSRQSHDDTELEYAINPAQMPDLAPHIHRQRLVVEGTCPSPIDAAEIRRYLSDLSEVCGMRVLLEPVTHRSERYGWAGWIHWETSGAHFYAWDEPVPFFSVDIYTCKAFDVTRVLEFTRDRFRATRLVATGF